MRPFPASLLAAASLLVGCAGLATNPGSADTDADPGPADGAGGGADASSAELDAFIRAQLEASRKPGLSAAVVRDGAVVWTRTYGLADVAGPIPVTTATLFETASVAKTLTAAALLQLWEQGALELDDDVSDYLPFAVRNPAAPTVPITFRQLLTHTSSIRDNWDVLESLSVADADATVSLAAFLEGYLAPGGAYYHASLNFVPGQGPGAGYEYANIGLGLVGYLVERISGQPFADYTRDHLFAPLGMATTGWHTPATSAVPYWDEGGQYRAEPRWGYPDWPAGHLYTTAGELGRFLAAFVQGGALEGTRILEPATVAEARRVQLPTIAPDQGLVWYYKSAGAFLGHEGADPGWTSEMFFRVSDGAGVVLLLNGQRAPAADDEGVSAIEERLFAVAGSL